MQIQIRILFEIVDFCVMSTMSHAPRDIHLIYFSHGNHGSKDDWSSVKRIISEKYPGTIDITDENTVEPFWLNGRDENGAEDADMKWHLLMSNSNGLKATSTHVGVFKGGENAAEELLQRVRAVFGMYYGLGEKEPKKERFGGIEEGSETPAESEEPNNAENATASTPEIVINLYWVSHSLGGLFSRAALKFLAQSPEWQKGIIKPCSYVSLCTPHLGSRRPSGGFINTLWSWGAYTYSYFLGQTGEDLFLRNEVLLDLSTKDEFVAPLKQFKSRTLISVCWFDAAVPYPSTAIRTRIVYDKPVTSTKQNHGFRVMGHSEFHPDLTLHFEKQFPNSKPYNKEDVVTEFKPTKKGEYHADDQKLLEFSAKMFEELNQIDWRRLDVQFQPRNSIDRAKMHEMVLAKHKIPFNRSQTMLEAGEEFVKTALLPILCKDREYFVEMVTSDTIVKDHEVVLELDEDEGAVEHEEPEAEPAHNETDSQADQEQ